MGMERGDLVQGLADAAMRLATGVRRGQRAVGPIRTGVLMHAAARGAVRPSDIADELEVHQSSVSRQMVALEAEGLIAVHRDPADQRACLIELTDAGRERTRLLTEAGLETFGGMVAGWSDARLERFVRDLQEFTEALEQLGARSGQRAFASRRLSRWRDE